MSATDNSAPRSNLIARLLSLAPEERAAAAWSFACFFTILSAYFLLRPVRDEMAILAGPENIPELFLGTFVATLFLVPVFGWITRRYPRRHVVPGAFAFFSLNLLIFFWAFGSADVDQVWAARAFFVWLSVFNMFVVSLFWSFMADVYSSEQAQRLFGLIAAGGSAGAICGPLATALLVGQIGIRPLFAVSALLLMGTVAIVFRLLRWADAHAHDEHPVTERQAIGGGILQGISLVLRTPYLLAIATVFLLGTFCGTAMYMLQAQLFAEHIPVSEQRTQLLASMDTAINTLTFVLQIAVARHAIARLGVALTLTLLPTLSVIAFLIVATNPGVAVLVVIQVLRRATNFGFNNPARETLFTVVSPQAKYKAKNFLDVTLVRGADVISSQAIRLIQSFGHGFAPVAWLCAGICAVWAFIAYAIGRSYGRLLRDEQSAVRPDSRSALQARSTSGNGT